MRLLCIFTFDGESYVLQQSKLSIKYSICVFSYKKRETSAFFYNFRNLCVRQHERIWDGQQGMVCGFAIYEHLFKISRMLIAFKRNTSGKV